MSFRKRNLLLLGLLVLLLFLTLLAAPAAAANPRHLSVLTQNAYVGADMVPALLATNYGDFLQAVQDTYGQAMASDLPKRGQAIADRIAGEQPDLVGLQEIARWQRTPPDSAAGEEVDMLEQIMAGLAGHGLSYTVLAQVEGFDGQFPTLDGSLVRLTNYDVLLARNDRPELKLSNVRSGRYDNRLVFYSPFAGWITIPRQWASVDVRVRGSSARVITTHLEAAVASVRVAQALELLAGPARTRLPVVVIGDLNAEIDDEWDASWLLLQHDFVDTWSQVHPGELGSTCCQAADLANVDSLLSKRIDLVLTRGTLSAAYVSVIEAKLVDSPAPYWLSDHAGVVAGLEMSK